MQQQICYETSDNLPVVGIRISEWYAQNEPPPKRKYFSLVLVSLTL
jgi:hypothetical protein